MNDYMKRRQEQILNGRPLPDKKTPKYIAKKSAKRLEKEKEQKASGVPEVGKLALEKWFMDIKIKHSLPPLGGTCCMECGEWIPPDFIRHATAHLLPKKLFKSVATHELNYLILGAGCGCHEKTHRVDKFVTMKIWPEAARRIEIMMPLLPFDELKYLSSQLLTALENT
jgi:hypothetical protein